MFGNKKKPVHSSQKNAQTKTDAAHAEARATEAERGEAAVAALSASSDGSDGTGPMTHIGRTVRILGEVTGREDLIIDGRVEGRVVLQHHGLTIAAHGDVKADLWADNIVVVGNVVGNLHAVTRIEVSDGGCVEGDLHAPSVVLAEGAKFKGRVDMMSEITPPPGSETNASRDTDSPFGSAFLDSSVKTDLWAGTQGDSPFSTTTREKSPALAAVGNDDATEDDAASEFVDSDPTDS